MNGIKRVAGVIMTSLFLLQFEMLYAVSGVDQGVCRFRCNPEPITQNVFADKDISSMKHLIDHHFCELFQKRFSDRRQKLQQFNQFFIQSSLHPSLLNQKNNSGEIKKSLSLVYDLMQHDMHGFIDYLKQHGFYSGQINKAEAQTFFKDVIQKYNDFAQLLFLQDDTEESHAFLFSLANHFFEYCFGDATWPRFKVLLDNQNDYPILRFLYATMWYFLAGVGWNDWHEKALEQLKKTTREGQWIVYVAGGSDIYQLLKHGMCRIKIIDPQLPSQISYYAQGWDWLVNDVSGEDEFSIHTHEGTDLVLHKVGYHEQGVFVATLASGNKINLPKSVVEWAVLEKLTKKRVGTVIFERRFCTQRDFMRNPKEVLLMSFNELHFIFTSDHVDNWGIDVNKFGKNTKIFVKQLRFPITKKTLCHLQRADASPFRFIKLGTSIN